MTDFDVLVLGGGPAGLSAAVTLARQRRSVLVVDDARPRNAAAGGVHAYLTRDGVPPAELLALGRDELTRYGGTVRTARATGATRIADGFAVTLEDLDVVTARRLVVTTGVVDELPAVDGLAEHWGRGVVHCPYCHGWEVRDRAIGVLVTSPHAVFLAQLFRQLSPDVVVFANGETLTAEQRLALTARGMPVVDGPVAAIHSAVDGSVDGVVLATGRLVARDVVVAPSSVRAKNPVLADLGLVPLEHPSGAGTYCATNPDGSCDVPGVWLAGNLVDPSAQVVTAAATGTRAGAMANADLVAAEVAAALADAPDAFDPSRMADPRYWDTWYARRELLWSGAVNPQLAAEVEGLPPGRALDVGCGEGADVQWLAERGWTVLGVDLSEVVLQRAALHTAGLPVDYEAHDLATWTPPTAAFDLVTAQFFHLPGALRRRVYAGLAAAVAPGGTLLLVGHDQQDVHAAHRPDVPDLFFTAEQLRDELAGEGWTVAVAESRPRTVAGPDGDPVTVRDVVYRAHRSGATQS